MEQEHPEEFTNYICAICGHEFSHYLIATGEPACDGPEHHLLSHSDAVEAERLTLDP